MLYVGRYHIGSGFRCGSSDVPSPLNTSLASSITRHANQATHKSATQNKHSAQLKQCKPAAQVVTQSGEFTSRLAHHSNPGFAPQQNILCSTPAQAIQSKRIADKDNSKSSPTRDHQSTFEAGSNSQSEHVRSVDNQSERSMSIADLSTTSALFGAGYKWTLHDDALLYSHVNQ